MSQKFKNNSNYSYKLHLHIKPNSKKQGISYDGEFFIISLQSKPVQNKANKELINFLKKKLDISSNQIEIISGAKSSTKIINIYFSHEIDENFIKSKLLN